MDRCLFVIDYQNDFVDGACTDSFDKALHKKVLDVLAGFQVNILNR